MMIDDLCDRAHTIKNTLYSTSWFSNVFSSAQDRATTKEWPGDGAPSPQKIAPSQTARNIAKYAIFFPSGSLKMLAL